MDKRELSFEEIRDLAFRATVQDDNREWMAHRYGKLTPSKFGPPISVMGNPESTNMQ